MNVKELREKLELAGIAIDDDEQINKMLEFVRRACENFAMYFEEFTDRIIPILRPYQDALTELDKVSEYQKYRKRKHNRQLLYERRKKLGRKL